MRISEKNKERIAEQILSFLYRNSPKTYFSSQIAQEIIRDEEFTKKLLLELYEKKLVNLIEKNSKGKSYKRRQRWTISDRAYKAYNSLAV